MGVQPGFEIDFDHIQQFLDKRRPGSSAIYSQRNESDKVEFLSGFLDGVTLGSSIGFVIKNSDQKSKDYYNYQDVFRPSHSDYTYESKYGIRDNRGGGRSSARETVNWVVAGAIATQILGLKNISIYSYVSAVGDIVLNQHYNKLNLNNIYNNNVRCPSVKTAALMEVSLIVVKKMEIQLGVKFQLLLKDYLLG